MSEMQREAINALAQVWSLSPDVRLGQLMAHLGFLGEAHLGKGLGDIENDELLAILYRHRAELAGLLSRVDHESLSPGASGISVSGSPTVPQTASVES